MASTRSNQALRALTLLSFFGGMVRAAPYSALHSRIAAPAYTRLGCFTDLVNGGRALVDKSTSSPTMTPDECAAFCGTDYGFFGVEYGSECFCGYIHQESSRASPPEDCNMPCAGDPLVTCGAGFRIEVYNITGYVPVVKGPASLPEAPYLGCFEDSGSRVLPGRALTSPSMTAAVCAEHCAGFKYFGTEFGSECYCGNDLPPHKAATEDDCTKPCEGNPFEYCGGGMRLSLYGFTEAPAPATNDDIGPFVYQGCHVDLPKRVLADKTVFSDEMTREACATACAGYSYFGVEYGSECYCSNVFDALASESRPEVECNVPCSGNASETCGAGMRLNVYHDPTATPIPATILDYTYEGCYEDSVASRILPDLIYHGHDMTLALCAEKCSAAGYEYFGVEFSQECFCGHELADGSAPAAGGDIECFMPCAGLGTQICGGPQRLTLYSKPAAQPPQPEPVAPNNIV